MQIAAIVAACALAALFVIVVVRPPPSGWLFCDVRENRCYAHNLCFYRETRGDVIKMGMAGLRLPEAVRGVGALPIWTMLYWRDTYPFYAAWVGGPYMSRDTAEALLLVRDLPYIDAHEMVCLNDAVFPAVPDEPVKIE